MDRQLRKSIQLKSLINVVEAAKNDSIYKRHRKHVKAMGKKVDNHPPVISTSKFHPQMLMKNAQQTMEWRARANMKIVAFLNEIARSKGKVDCYNPVAAFRNSKVENKIIDQTSIEKLNKKFFAVLKSIEATKDLSTKDLAWQWRKKLLPSIIDHTNFPISIQSLVMPDFDLQLQNPPSHAVFSKSWKVRLTFNLCSRGTLGSVLIMLNPFCDENHVNRFLDICRSRYKVCVVSKILQDILIEAGEQTSSDGIAASLTSVRQFPGTLSLLEDDDGEFRKFCLSLKSFPLDARRSFELGRVVKGFDTLTAINSYGSAYGKPSKTIYIRRCRLFK